METLPRSLVPLSAYGGAFYAGNVEELNITNVIFQENESEANGGALAVDSIDDVYSRQQYFRWKQQYTRR